MRQVDSHLVDLQLLEMVVDSHLVDLQLLEMVVVVSLATPFKQMTTKPTQKQTIEIESFFLLIVLDLLAFESSKYSFSIAFRSSLRLATRHQARREQAQAQSLQHYMF